MRDNHTFRPLPLDVEAALEIMRAERDAGQTHGMLCGNPSILLKGVVHAPGAAKWKDFEQRARAWLEAAIEVKVPPTPEEELTKLRTELAAMTKRADDAQKGSLVWQDLAERNNEWAEKYRDERDEARAENIGLRESFYKEVNRAVENVRREMRVKTVVMRADRDCVLPIIDAHGGHIIVGPVCGPRPPLPQP
jgi:hypothetical protein